MADHLDRRILGTLSLFSGFVGLFAVALGGAVLLGWWVGSPGLVTLRPGLAAMTSVTASLFVLSGVSLLARQASRPRAAAVAALVAFLVAAPILVDELIVQRDRLDPWIGNRIGPLVGQTAPATALGFVLLATALLTLGRNGLAGRIALAASGSGALLFFLVLLGYAYGVDGLYAASFFHSVALHTAVGLFLLFLACFVHEPASGWSTLIASSTPIGSATRGQLLITILVPCAVGYAVVQGIGVGAIPTSLGIALVVATTLAAMVVRIFRDGQMLETLDSERRSALQGQRTLNAELEQRVTERTISLSESEARLRTYFDHAPEAIAVFRRTAAGRFVFDAVNPAYRAVFALPSDPAGQEPAELTDPAAASDIQQQLSICLESGRVHEYTAERSIAGQTRAIHVVLAPVLPAASALVLGTMRDVTETRDRDEQLRQAYKMDAIGQLTGGLAHDFNNLLAGIGGSLELMDTRIAQNRTESLPRYIEAAQAGVRRAAALTHRLLSFSRRQTLDPQPTDINRLVAGMEELLSRTVGPEITIEIRAAPGLWTALLDPNQVENALLNLCINARDAMQGGGRLTIHTDNITVGPGGMNGVGPGEYPSMCVTDTGTGMTPDVAARAFDPFFTTKPIGQGTGLGLSMIYGFVRQSGGHATIETTLGQGTTICLHFPRHHAPSAPALSTAPVIAPTARQAEGILLVDDEPTLRALVAESLADLGYTIHQAEDAAAALVLLQSTVAIDLLVTDVGLPGGLNGRQLADAARTGRPGLKVLFVTGYADVAVLNHGDLEAGMHLLTKPFPLATLAGRVGAILAPSA